MNEVKVCSDDILGHLFPGSEKMVEDGYFKVVRAQTGDNVLGPIIFRFTNLSRFAPTGPMYQDILVFLATSGVKEASVVFRSYGIMGLEITSK